jgi:hypothetical protein
MEGKELSVNRPGVDGVHHLDEMASWEADPPLTTHILWGLSLCFCMSRWTPLPAWVAPFGEAGLH